METHLLRKLLRFYQQRMIEARTIGDIEAYSIYRQMTRELSETIHKKEKSA